MLLVCTLSIIKVSSYCKLLIIFKMKKYTTYGIILYPKIFLLPFRQFWQFYTVINVLIIPSITSYILATTTKFKTAENKVKIFWIKK